MLDAAIAELNEFIKTLELFGVKNAYIDLSIARGLAYYTGLVFEFKSLKYPELGTVAGGGRYADLAGKFSKTKIIGVGAAIYLNEYAKNKKVVKIIELATETLSGIPSIIYGLVGMLFFCLGSDSLYLLLSENSLET